MIGADLGKECIKQILDSLEIRIENETETGLSLLVPPYRVDVTRECDVIEDILRIYGYNNIAIPTQGKCIAAIFGKTQSDQTSELGR